jgi:hypothetical protein
MRFACWITKAKDRHSEYLIVIVFPLQRERACVLRYTYTACLAAFPKRPDSLLYNGHRRWFAGVKLPKHQADHSPPSSAEVNNSWSQTYTPPIRLHIADREDFTYGKKVKKAKSVTVVTDIGLLGNGNFSSQ